jgi:hypothetical protein
MQVVISSSVESFSPSHLGGDELGDQVIGGPRAAVLDIGAQEGDEGLGRGDGLVLHRAGAAGHVHADHRVRPAQEVGGHLLGHAEEAGDDADGQRLGEGLQKVEIARGKRRQFGGSAVMSGARPAIRREVKARRTRLRKRVWRGGSSSSMECASTA